MFKSNHVENDKKFVGVAKLDISLKFNLFTNYIITVSITLTNYIRMKT